MVAVVDDFLSEEDYLPYRPLPASDPAYWMLQKGLADEAEGKEGWVTKTTAYNERCYICRDPEFALMGLPLCKPCNVVVDGVVCGAHTPADDCVCDEGHDVQVWHESDGNEY